MDSCHDQIHPASTPLPKKKQNHDMLLSIQNKFEKEMKWKDKKKKKKLKIYHVFWPFSTVMAYAL